MNYIELKDYLRKNPFCFQSAEERKREFDQKVNEAEKKIIQFAEAKPKRPNLEA